MATEIAQAYVQIIPSAKGMQGKLGEVLDPETKKAGESSGATLGSSLVGAVKKIVVGAGIGTFIKSSLDAGGALQQSFGGLDTIYGAAGEAAKKYAYEAQKAGISANDYAEQAVSFGASLKQAFGGDTTKAVESANTAIMDMTDNAAKMGTPIENIQNAYQGFAKQNYTMLDNLKLGYGGTKTEMERLLADATKLSGVEYNMDNLGDVYEAIHVIQGELGLTGVAADEAANTFTGSMGAMKAAWDNLLANLATGGDISSSLQQVVGNAIAFVQNNMIPMLGNVLEGLPDLVDGLIGGFTRMISATLHNNPQMLQSGVDLILSLVDSVTSALPYLLEVGLNIVNYLVEALTKTDWGKKLTHFAEEFVENMQVGFSECFAADDATGMIKSFVQSITEALPKLLEAATTIVTFLLDAIVQNLPSLVSAGADILLSLIEGLIENVTLIVDAIVQLLPTVIEAIVNVVPDIIVALTEALVNHAGDLLSGIIDLVASLLTHLPEIIVMIVAGIGEIVISIVEKFSELGPQLIAKSDESVAKIKESFLPIVDFFKECWENIKTTYKAVDKFFNDAFKKANDAIRSVFQNIGQYFVGKWNEIKNAFKDAITAFKDIGKNIVDGIKNGITEGWESLKSFFTDKVGGLIDGAKEVLGIHSPSREFMWIGEMLTAGFNKGLEGFGDEAIDKIGSIVDEAEAVGSNMQLNSNLTSSLMTNGRNLGNATYAPYGQILKLLNTYLPAMAEDRDTTITLQGDAKNIFSAVRDENRKLKTATGYHALA